MPTASERFNEYLKIVSQGGFKKLAKIEFLQPDDSVAFALDGKYKNGYMRGHDSRAFIQDGSLKVSLRNGARRQATITLANLDGAFDYNVNKLWFGQRIRLSMGVELSDGSEFYLPQGVFYLKNPQNVFNPTGRTATLPLVDKWAYLDGSLFGNLENTYQVNAGTNVFDAIASILQLSKYDLQATNAAAKMIDGTTPVFTSYYNGKTYKAVDSDGSIISDVAMTDTPYTITEAGSGNFGSLILLLNDTIVGMIGYDENGALRIEPSQDNIDDADKPVIWNFTPKNSGFLGLTETVKNTDVYNDVLIIGEGLTGAQVWGRASNYDGKSDTNINLIGKKTYREEKAEYFNSQQCVSLASWQLKRKTVLQKSVTISSPQLFHLVENRLVSVVRTDKEGEPTEKHIIQSFSLPIGQTGEMSINCTSVNDYPVITTRSSSDDE